jgi:hypothetical protein
VSFLGPKDDTQPWKGRYAPYDLIKELCIAVGVITLLAVLLTVLLSSPDEKPSTIGQWSHQLPVDFATTASTELNETSPTAEYGPPTTTTRAACSTSCSCTRRDGSASAIRSTRPRTT